MDENRLNKLARVLLTPIIFILWLIGYEKYVGEDRFVDYWKGFGE